MEKKLNAVAGSIRILVFLLSGVILFSACGSARNELTAAKTAEIETQVKAAFDGLVEAAKMLKTEAYLEYFDQERFTSLNENGTVTLVFDEFAEDYREQTKTFSGYESLEFKNVKVNVINETTAVLVNEFKVKVAMKSGNTITAGGAGTQVWSRKGRVWKLVHVSSSSK